jgi:hypothetical protein
MQNIPPEIQDLVDNPREVEHIELKDWVDLTDDANRAKTARHLAALCNHGGGYIIFGFRDDHSPSTAHPGDLSRFNRDTIAGIVDRYLAPAFQCEVFHVAGSGSANKYAVVRVPAHGAVPVCAKRNGPQDKKGNPQGIRQGAYYIRVPGPKSAAIETPDQWRELIHRCVVTEREGLLASISKIIRTPVPAKSQGESIEDWHRKLHSHYLGLLETNPPDFPVSVKENHYQLTYRFIRPDGSPILEGNSLLEAIRQAGEHVRNVVWTGWSMFHPFTKEEIKPRFVTDLDNGHEIDALETVLVGQTFIAETLPDYWRITADGRATIIRPYREDRTEVPHLAKQGLNPGMWLSPRILAREVYELVAHAKELAKFFAAVDAVEFRCTWYGLKDRRIADFDPAIDWYDRTCRINERTTASQSSVEALTGDPDAIVLALATPVARLFDGLEITSSELERWRPTFRQF